MMMWFFVLFVFVGLVFWQLKHTRALSFFVFFFFFNTNNNTDLDMWQANIICNTHTKRC